MGKKKQKDTETKSVDGDVPAQSGIFSTLFGGVVSEGESTGVSNLFSDDNPFRRKATEPKPVSEEEKSEDAGSDVKKVKKKKRDIGTDTLGKNDDEEIAATSSLKGKRSKKEKENDGSDEEKDSNEGIAQGEKSLPGSNSKRMKRKRDAIEKEYEEKRYGKDLEGVEKKEKIVGEKRKKADEVEDTMVVKEGFDDENKLLRTVFVGNLPLKIKKKVIMKEFSKFGEVESVRIRSVPIADSKKTRKGAILQKQLNENASSVHAYVVFKTEQSAEASLAYNMSLISGNHIRVDRACPPRKKLKAQDAPLYDSKRTVFVGNLPFDVKDEELYQLFTSMNNIGNTVEAIRVIRDPHLNIGKGIAYVLFKSWEAANFVAKKGNLKLRDRELRLSRAKSDSTPSKRKNHASDAFSPSNKSARDSKFTSPGGKGIEKSILSYQGLRSTKSSGSKKNTLQKSPGLVKKTKPKVNGDKTGSQSQKQGKQKRPAVAARKAKAKGSNESGVKRAGNKRKQDSGTPENSRKKKPRRF